MYVKIENILVLVVRHVKCPNNGSTCRLQAKVFESPLRGQGVTTANHLETRKIDIPLMLQGHFTVSHHHPAQIKI